jgi:hypothetical protein
MLCRTAPQLTAEFIDENGREPEEGQGGLVGLA